MEKDEMLARLRRCQAVIGSIAVAGKQSWQALLLVLGDLEAIEAAVAEQKEER